jgi:hypothetical protein
MLIKKIGQPSRQHENEASGIQGLLQQYLPIPDIQEFGSHQKKNPGTLPRASLSQSRST